jgi:hypothetical protein
MMNNEITVSREVVSEYIAFFFSRIVGFKNQEIKYISMNHGENEYLSIAMDKIDRLTRKSGRLRNRVWSNCYFIFHKSEIDPSKAIQEKVEDIKNRYPFLFIRSYVYFIYVNISKGDQLALPINARNNIETNNYKIWLFNSKYEVNEETSRTNLFGIKLEGKEIIDDYIYLANPESEIQRIEAANSDAIDCVKAFTGDLELLEQTSDMLEVIRAHFDKNPQARIILEGPARSGKTIIAATLLGEHEGSKFLLMNYFFYQAIVDGFHALSGWDKKEIEALVSNPELDVILSLKKSAPGLLKKISNNLRYAIKECDDPNGSKTKSWLMENMSGMMEILHKIEVDEKSNHLLLLLTDMSMKLTNTDDDQPFTSIDKNELIQIQEQIDDILSGKYDTLASLLEMIVKTIEEIIVNSRQKIFHHNINNSVSSKLKEGCWIERGNPTTSKMWTRNYKPQLIICDEVQRLGIIPEYQNAYVHRDKYDEVGQILKNSHQSFFAGDDFQMLNSKYDQGIDRISKELESKSQNLIKLALPESIGVPAEIGILMKYLTNPTEIDIGEVITQWHISKEFKIVIIQNNVDQFISTLDIDPSNKKHLAAPLNYDWLGKNGNVEIVTPHRNNPIVPLSNHETENFAYKFPYFCNEEIMPNYILSAYELISREVESLYVHIPYFDAMKDFHEEWYRKHLYVLFTRPTSKLVVNYEVKEEYVRLKNLVNTIKNHGAKVDVEFLEN